MSLKIYRPIQSNYKTQSFGESKACATVINGQTIVVGKINGVCPAGTKDLYTEFLGLKGHNGEDWRTWRGEPLYFPVVSSTLWTVKTEVDSAGGIGVNVISKSPILGYYRKFKFWHLHKVAVHDKQEIKAGQLLGFCDSTGLSSGDHLHWSMKKCDQNGEPLNRWNGYYGAEDFSEWFENVFIVDYMREELKKQIVTAQLSLIQLLNKYIFVLQEQLKRVAEKVGGFLRI